MTPLEDDYEDDGVNLVFTVICMGGGGTKNKKKKRQSLRKNIIYNRVD